MADRLERSVQAQREFVANASHQLRTPLTAMKLRLEGAIAERRTDEPDASKRRTGRSSSLRIVDRLWSSAGGERADRPTSTCEKTWIEPWPLERWRRHTTPRRPEATEDTARIDRPTWIGIDNLLDNATRTPGRSLESAARTAGVRRGADGDQDRAGPRPRDRTTYRGGVPRAVRDSGRDRPPAHRKGGTRGGEASAGRTQVEVHSTRRRPLPALAMGHGSDHEPDLEAVALGLGARRRALLTVARCHRRPESPSQPASRCSPRVSVPADAAGVASERSAPSSPSDDRNGARGSHDVGGSERFGLRSGTGFRGPVGPFRRSTHQLGSGEGEDG
jgi:hypothetical protein